MIEVILPKVDIAMTEGTIAVWHKREGDAVKAGEPLFDVMTDKADVAVEADAAGTLWGVTAQPGDTVKIGQVVAYILAPGEAPPIAVPVAEANVREQFAAHPTTNGGQATASDARPTLNARLRATPLARKISREQGIDLALVSGSGPNGRISSQDVRTLLARRAEAPADPHSNGQGATSGTIQTPDKQPALAPQSDDVTYIAFTGLRRIVAERMTASVRNAPHFTLNVQVDAIEMVTLRERVAPAIERQIGVKPSFTAILARAVAPLLPAHPYLNATLEHDTIVLHRRAHIGVALDRNDDLLVPVIRDAHRMTLAEIAAALHDLSSRARDRKLTPDELRGGTFTISNLGMYGVDSFTAIINSPESAILAVGRLVETGVVRDGALVVRPIVNLTLSADHRIVNGAAAARFLTDLRERLENPLLLL
jgi:pyruvate dehydrogenase E2 component (dihydrolipoamide acetyltransferase)